MGDVKGFSCGKSVGGPVGSLTSPVTPDLEAKARARMAFINLAEAVVKHVAHTKFILTTDDVWAYLDEFNCSHTPERRNIGVAMTRACKKGIIMPSSSYVKSVRKRVNHGREIRVWYSLFYEVNNEREQTPINVKGSA